MSLEVTGKENALRRKQKKINGSGPRPEFTSELSDLRCCDGDSATFQCRLHSGGKAVVQWRKDGVVLPDSAEFRQTQVGQSLRLRISRVHPEDQGQYTCVASNDAGRAASRACLIVDVPEDSDLHVTSMLSSQEGPPPVAMSRHHLSTRTTPARLLSPRLSVPRTRAVSEQPGSYLLPSGGSAARARRRLEAPRFYAAPHDRTAEEGENVTLKCSVSGQPGPVATWDKESTTLRNSDKFRVTEAGDERLLLIRCVQKADAGLYRVTIQNDAGRMQATARLSVIGRPRPLSPMGVSSHDRPGSGLGHHRRPRSRNDSSGRSGVADLLSHPASGVWFCDGELAPGSQPIRLADGGATTPFPDSKTSPAADGKAPPVFVHPLRDMTVLEGERVRLDATVTGAEPLKVTWVKNNAPVRDCADFRHVTAAGGHFSLVFNDIYPADEGFYFCEAWNAHGRTVSHCHVTVKEDDGQVDISPTTDSTSVREVAAPVGSAVRLWVRSTGVASVDWSLNGRPVQQLNQQRVKVYQTVGAHALEILRLIENDVGTVEVSVRGPAGSWRSQVALSVTAPPDAGASRAPAAEQAGESITSIAASAAAAVATDDISAENDISDSKEEAAEDSDTGERVDSGIGLCASRYRAGEEPSVSVSAEEPPTPRTEEPPTPRTEESITRTEEPPTPRTEESITRTEERAVITDESADRKESITRSEQETPSRKSSFLEAVSRKSSLTGDRRLIVEGPASLAVLLGQTARLECRLQADTMEAPAPTAVWSKAGRDLQPSERVTIEAAPGGSVLTLRQVTADDSGKYVVRVGQDECWASLAVEGPPEPPSGVPNICRISQDSITLSWCGPPFDGGSMVTEYQVEACDEQQQWRLLVDHCRSTSVVVSAGDLPESPCFRVRAVNKHGSSAPGLEAAAPAFVEDEPAQKPPVEEVEQEERDVGAPFSHRHVTLASGVDFRAQYDVQEELGKGRFGTVHKVMELSTGNRFAAKFIKCIKSADRAKVGEEIAIMNQLNHPKLLQLAAAVDHGREMIMLLEYVSGGELFERVVADDFMLTEHECVLFMQQISSGVQYMHECNIMHLDMKPENILCITKSSHLIKIIDFGLARQYRESEPTRVMLGTPEFIPPEIINYEPISPRSDMWSLGVICYILLSGLSPFMGDSDAETFNNITRADYDFDDDAFDAVSEAAKDFITSLLKKRQTDRMSALDALRHPWLTVGQVRAKATVLSKEKLKKFIIRRKWQKTGNAIRALGRMSASLPARRASQQRRASREAALLSAPAGLLQQKRGSLYSERSDSGFSDCSVGSGPRVSRRFTNESTLTEEEEGEVADLLRSVIPEDGPVLPRRIEQST